MEETKNKKKGEWFESWFESDLYDIMYRHRDQQEANNFLTKLLNSLDPKADARFLDLACGTGRHARYIHERGYHVIGTDLSSRKIAIASQRTDDGLEFYIQDMRKPFRINYFDFVLNLFTSFGYFDDVRDNIRVLKSVKSGLKNGGTFVIDYLNSKYVKDHIIAKEEKIFGDWSVEISKSISGNRLTKNMFWSNGVITRTYAEKVTLFSFDELKELLQNQSFTIKNIYGDYDLNPFDVNHSPRLIIESIC